LRPYQETGAKWLWLLSRLGLGACLADDMGLGKTIQVIALLLVRKKERAIGGATRPALLVLPASLLANWKAEMQKFAPTLTAEFAHPSQTKVEDLQEAAANPEAFAANADVVLTTYGMLSRQEWLRSLEWGLVVLDEAQAIKNPAARQTRAVKELKAPARIVLTGTPVENRLTDLWSIFDFLCPGLLGSAKTFGDFVKRLATRQTDQYAPLRKLVGPYILRRLKTDKSIIADLPDKTEMRAFCGLTKKQAVLYEQAVRELEEALAGVAGIERRGVILAFILRFKQICNHPAQWLASGEYAPVESGKFRRLEEICGEIGERQEKALVFTQFREMTEPLARFLNTVFGRPGLVLHGGTVVKKRKEIVDEFQREDGPPFLVLSLKAGGTGLNLTAASHVIHFDRWWNPAVENQATDRVFRIGQKKNVVVHKFICQGTVEEKIDALIQDKTHLAGEILEGGAPKLITEMNDVELLKLVRLDVNQVAED
jgi:non-specific serine/threonine protein kinase